MQLQFRKINPDAKTPTPYNGGLGHEIYPLTSVSLHPNDRGLYLTGITVKVPDGFELQVRTNPDAAMHRGLVVADSPSGVTGVHEREIYVILHNVGDDMALYPFNDVPIALLVLAPVQPVEFIETTPLAEVS